MKLYLFLDTIPYRKIVMRSVLSILLIFISSFLHAQTKRGDVLVEFSIKDGYYFAEMHQKGWREPQSVKLCKEESLDIATGGPALYSGESAKQLYESIVKPMEKYLRRGDNVFFTPAGSIYFINIAALISGSGEVLGDVYHLHRLSSLNEYSSREEKLPHVEWLLFGGIDYLADPDLMYSSVRMLHLHNNEHLYKDIVPKKPTDELSFGIAEDGTRAGFKNLQHSREEIKDIWALRNYGMVFFTGFKACEEEFRFRIRQNTPYIVLLSTHSFTYGNQWDEMASGLLFSGAGHTLEGRVLPYNLNDGILYAQEIETLEMDAASMVVLAACNTGLGIVTQNGVKGLQSAFKKAGAKTLVLTLWSVNDRATAAFTKSLFTHLDEGRTKRDAFELTIKDMRNSKEFRDPVYWAPFIMLD